MKESIGVYANHYQKIMDGKAEYLIPAENLVRLIKRNPGVEKLLAHKGKVLDFGCGDGRHCVYFSSNGFLVHGVDVSREAIDCADRTKENFELDFTLQEIKNADELDGKYSLVVAWEVLHWTAEKLEESFNHLVSLVEDEGYFIFTLPAEDHYLKRYSKTPEGDVYTVNTSEDRMGCVFSAPREQSILEVLKKNNLEIIDRIDYKFRYDRDFKGRDDYFSSYSFCVQKNRR